MTAIERITEMLELSGTTSRLFPATIYYNEGWLLRLTLDWFSRQAVTGHPLDFSAGARWFSEALLPSQFFAQRRGDQLAEGWTHADAVIGQVSIGDAALADTKLLTNATQLLVTEAKLFSPLSPGVTRAAYYDQAARNVACIAEVLCRAGTPPNSLSSIGFLVLAPQEQISARVFTRELSKESIHSTISRRVSEYSSPEREKKEQWFREWCLPTVQRAKIDSLAWESIVDHIRTQDSVFAIELKDFYAKCLEFNRIQERDQV
jgi:hypothetical protein